MPEPRPDVAALMETVVRGLSRPGYGGDGKWLPAHPSEAETLEAPAALTALAERIAEAKRQQRAWKRAAHEAGKSAREFEAKLAKAEEALERGRIVGLAASEIRDLLRSLRGET